MKTLMRFWKERKGQGLVDLILRKGDSAEAHIMMGTAFAEAQENKKAIAAQIRQLIEVNRAPKGDGDVAYNFQDANKIQRIYVTEATRNQIVRGELVIVRLGDVYELVPKFVAEKITQRDPDCVLTVKEATPAAEADAYAKYKIPDDLIW